MAAYTRVEYIESSGTQYIDTGFKPNNNTRVVMDFEPLSNVSLDESYAFFGSRDTNKKKEYFCCINAKTGNYNLYWQFDDLYTNIWDVKDLASYAVRRTVDCNGATATIDGITKTYPARTFQTQYSLYLLASNEMGEAKYLGYTRLYSCQIYDDGTLIRDYVPAKRKPDGAVGLLDKLNNVFYGNAGTGEFIAGPEVPTFDTTTFLSGLTMGLCGKGVAEISGSDTFTRGYLLGTELRNKRPEREPVAYLYNGVRLPELPPDGDDVRYEWDREAFPFAFLLDLDGMVLFVYSVKPSFNTSSETIDVTAEGKMIIYLAQHPSTAPDYWENVVGDVETISPGSGLPLPMWANFDILDENGTEVLAASEPVPVYE